MFFLKKNKIVKKIGYKKDQDGIIRRYLRENGGWDSHLQHTKEFILQSAKNKAKGSVLVLGSGWWLDVPVLELAQTFRQVLLLDIVHPKLVQQKVKKLSNVKLLTADITGGASNAAYAYAQMLKKDKNTPKEPLFDFNSENFGLPSLPDVDFVVSVNILNQLDIIIADFLWEQKHMARNLILDVKANIQEKHINALPKTKSCLITDFREKVYSFEHEPMRETELLFTKMPKANFSQKWIWDFDTTGTYNEQKITRMDVLAIDF